MATIVEEKKVQQEEAKTKAEGSEFSLPQYLGEVRTEFNKISWPSKEQVTREFASVLILVSILTGIIFVLDKAFGVISNYFMGK